MDLNTVPPRSCIICDDHKESWSLLDIVSRDIAKNCGAIKKLAKEAAIKDEVAALEGRLMNTIRIAIVLFLFILGTIGGTYAYVNKVAQDDRIRMEGHSTWGHTTYHDINERLYQLDQKTALHDTMIDEKYSQLIQGQFLIQENQKNLLNKIDSNTHKIMEIQSYRSGQIDPPFKP